jgi:hypothetical protein
MKEEIGIPAWAEAIQVKASRNRLIVVGRNRLANPVTYASDPAMSKKGPIRNSAPLMAGTGGQSASGPHIEFAHATLRSQQKEFVQKYGPVKGIVKRITRDKQNEALISRIVVEQDIHVLEHEQTIFRIALALVAELREQKPNLDRIASLFMDAEAESGFEIGASHGEVAMLESTFPRSNIHKKLSAILDDDEEGYGRDPDQPQIEKLFILHSAHLAVAKFLNECPPYVTFFDGQPAELPEHNPDGILPVLYFMLRRDYLGGRRRISTCEFDDCGIVFRVARTGQRFCDERHSRLQRQRNYWNKKGKLRRSERRRKGKP